MNRVALEQLLFGKKPAKALPRLDLAQQLASEAQLIQRRLREQGIHAADAVDCVRLAQLMRSGKDSKDPQLQCWLAKLRDVNAHQG